MLLPNSTKVFLEQGLMGMLSDESIQNLMRNGWLIPSGDPIRARECSYSCLPGRGFAAGEESKPIDFTKLGGGEDYFVLPGQMIWIRTSDRVKLPNDIVAFWWQTNSLSRKGLMLVNMSMVEPGYEGDLACLFVNTGKTPILITPQTVIAKLVFSRVDGRVRNPYSNRQSREEYDAKIRELAAGQPKTFLRVADLANELQRKLNESLDEVRSAVTAGKSEVQSSIEAEKRKAVSDFETDTKSVILKAFGWAALALAMLGTVSFGIDFLKGEFDIEKTARSKAEEVISERIRLDGNLSNSEIHELLSELADQKARIEKLEKPK